MSTTSTGKSCTHKLPSSDALLLKEAQILTMLAISRSTWWRWVRVDPELLTPIRLGRNSTRWRASAVLAFVDQAEQRGANVSGRRGGASA